MSHMNTQGANIASPESVKCKLTLCAEKNDTVFHILNIFFEIEKMVERIVSLQRWLGPTSFRYTMVTTLDFFCFFLNMIKATGAFF